jgi:sigma-B regulation protein RsbU (phosphoserine phosphatase)
VLVADVCGHGVSAAFITAMTKISFQNSCHLSLDPAVVLGRMNRELCSTLKHGYVTVFYGVYDQESRNFSFASGGHPPLLVHRRADNQVQELWPQATFLGFFNPVDFTVESITLEPGDRVFFYTDGLYESQPVEEEYFGQERVVTLIRDHRDEPLQPLLDRLMDTLIDFMGGQPFEDDITLVGLEIR